MVRKHWFVLVAELMGVTLFALAPFILLMALLFLPNDMPLNIAFSDHYAEAVFAMTLWTALCVMAAMMIWTHYYLDLWAITDRRIIVIDQISFFNRRVSSFRLERLQDMKVSIDGLIPTLLNFGSIRAQTASSADSNFHTYGLPDPRNLQSLIQQATDKRLKTIHGKTRHVIDN